MKRLQNRFYLIPPNGSRFNVQTRPMQTSSVQTGP